MVYILMIVFKKNAGKVIFVETFIFLSFFHLYRQIFDYGSWRLDITTITMMLVCKYTAFAFSYADSFKKPE
jgi:lysophospholipid acyltransferase